MIINGLGEFKGTWSKKDLEDGIMPQDAESGDNWHCFEAGAHSLIMCIKDTKNGGLNNFSIVEFGMAGDLDSHVQNVKLLLSDYCNENGITDLEKSLIIQQL